jgi:NDP-hexose 4-ketoreductase
MPVILVMGANGFIGRHLAADFAARPDLTVVGAGLGAAPEGLDDGWLDLDLLAGDGRLTAELRRLDPAALVNCTGATVGGTADLFRLNVLVTDAILAALRETGSQARLVHLGSAAEYGPGPAGVPVSEAAFPLPVSPYGIAKLAATYLVLAAARQGTNGVVLRVFNALGPGMPENSLPGAATRRLAAALESGAGRVEFGPLDSVRDFVDVRDIASATLAACLTPVVPPLVNVATGQGHSARDLVVALASAMGYRGEIGEGAATASPRSADAAWQVADITVARRALDWAPAHDLRSSVESMLADRAGV